LSLPINTIRFDPEVIDILKDMEVVRQNGIYLAILHRQLERNLYARTNKALELLGGTWNREAKAHIFKDDPTVPLGVLVACGFMTITKEGWFPTPEAVIREMFQRVAPEGELFLEPEAGEGAIATALLDKGIPITNIACVELNPGRVKILEGKGFRVRQMDFLDMAAKPVFDRIYMNPPFENNADIHHVRHAFDFLKPQGGALVSVMSEGILFRSTNLAREFRDFVAKMDGEFKKLPASSFKESGTQVSTILLTIRKP
jgi:hypothetical protein